MFVSPCPVCGRSPEIREFFPTKKGLRRRLCKCPSLCSVLPRLDNLNGFCFIYFGEGDANAIFKSWNLGVERYKSNKQLDWSERDFSPWWNDANIEVG